MIPELLCVDTILADVERISASARISMIDRKHRLKDDMPMVGCGRFQRFGFLGSCGEKKLQGPANSPKIQTKRLGHCAHSHSINTSSSSRPALARACCVCVVWSLFSNHQRLLFLISARRGCPRMVHTLYLDTLAVEVNITVHNELLPIKRACILSRITGSHSPAPRFFRSRSSQSKNRKF
jgi:hypothetical protein